MNHVDDEALPLSMRDLVKQTTQWENRIGVFRVHTDLVKNFSTELKIVMSKCLILRAEALLATDSIEYWALSDHFRKLLDDEMVPNYVWHINKEGKVWCEEVLHRWTVVSMAFNGNPE